MNTESTTSNTPGEDIEDLYIKLIDSKNDNCQNLNFKVYKIGSLSSAFLALLCYTGTNYISGTQNSDVYAGKISNSLCLGLFATIYIAIMVKQNNKKYIETLEIIFPWLLVRQQQTIEYSEIMFRNNEDYHQLQNKRKRELKKAWAVSFLCGLLNALATTLLYIAFDDASAHGYNISIWTAVLSGNWIIVLIASFTIFEDKITLFQTLGVFINLSGILTVSIGQSSGGVTPLMIVLSALASASLGLRIILARYWSNRINSLIFININFIADFVFGIAWILISIFGLFEFKIDLKAQSILFLGGILMAGAEIFLFLGIERGVAGVVVSIAGSNGIVVGLLNWAIQGAVPSMLQAIAIILAFTGILTLSLGDIIKAKFLNRLASL